MLYPKNQDIKKKEEKNLRKKIISNCEAGMSGATCWIY